MVALLTVIFVIEPIVIVPGRFTDGFAIIFREPNTASGIYDYIII
jgi:hypothetical protein